MTDTSIFLGLPPDLFPLVWCTEWFIRLDHEAGTDLLGALLTPRPDHLQSSDLKD